MPSIAPCNFRLKKAVNHSFLIAVTYSEVPAHPDQLDVAIEFTNTTDNTATAKAAASDDSNGQLLPSSDGWFKSLWLSEKAPLAEPNLPDVSLFLGYIQLFGYIRLNRVLGGDTTLDASTDIFWKNLDYTSNYGPKDDSVFDGIVETPFMKDHGSTTPRKSRVGGIGDLNTKKFDPTAIHLLHDLAHTFNTLELPGQTAPPIPEQYHQSLAEDIHECIVPFYVTAQHLLFSSQRLGHGENQTFRVRIPVPANTLPPSYNTKLTGSAGDNGAVSICYSCVVGILEQLNGVMQPRAVYFPLELKPGEKGWDREWVQRDYLQETVVDQKWAPQTLEDAASTDKLDHIANGNRENVRSTKDKFVRDLDLLVESSIHVVAANERRKSSVSLFSSNQPGQIQQVPLKLKVSYQIRVNNQTLCTLTLSKPYFHVGDDIHFFLELHEDSAVSTRVVGLTAHVEAHEIFHVESETSRKVVNYYKVTPTIKINTFADALADAYLHNSAGVVASALNLPRFLTQQFQASTFMDLKYFLVCRFVLNEFDTSDAHGNIDDDSKRYADYIQEYKVGNELADFKFLIPLTVLP